MLFQKACFLGWMVAIPVGPVGLLIIQRSITMGYVRGLFSGLGAALADGVFGFLAAIGLVALIENYGGAKHFIRPLGGLVLAIVGIVFILKKKREVKAEEVLTANYANRYLWDLLSTFLLTLMNPMTIIAFGALFAGADLIPVDVRKIQYLEVSLGVFTGSLLWWVLLVILASPLKNKMSVTLEQRIQQVIGAILLTLAVFSVVPRFSSFIDRVQNLLK